MVKHLTGEQVITAALVRGVAFSLRSDGKIYVDTRYGPISLDGRRWLAPYRSEVAKALAPENTWKLESCIRAGLGGVWLEAHRRALAKLEEDNPTWTAQRLNMVAWAQVLGEGRPIPWPEVEEAEEVKKGPVKSPQPTGPEVKPRPQERHTGQLFKDDRRWTA